MKNAAQKIAMVVLLTLSVATIVGCDDGGGSGKRKNNNNNNNNDVYYPGTGFPGTTTPVLAGNVDIERANQMDYELFLEKTLEVCNYRASFLKPACRDISSGGRLDLILDNPNNPWLATFTYTAYSSSNSRFFSPSILNFNFSGVGQFMTKTESNQQVRRDQYQPTPYVYIDRKGHEFELVLNSMNRGRMNVSLLLDGRVIARANLQTVNMVPLYQQYNSFSSQGQYVYGSSSRTYSY
jgi:hypothetical protein